MFISCDGPSTVEDNVGHESLILLTTWLGTLCVITTVLYIPRCSGDVESWLLWLLWGG
jgi:hypothetical protein